MLNLQAMSTVLPSVLGLAVVYAPIVLLDRRFGIYVALLLVGGSVWLRRREGGIAEIGFRRPADVTRTLGLGAAVGVLSYVVVIGLLAPLIQRWAGLPPPVERPDTLRGNTATWLTLLALMWIHSGFIEEIIFRGYFITQLKRVLGESPARTALAIVVAAAAFGMMHRPIGPQAAISAGIGGLILGTIFVRAGCNLWPAILAHGLFNTAGITLRYLGVSLPDLIWR